MFFEWKRCRVVSCWCFRFSTGNRNRKWRNLGSSLSLELSDLSLFLRFLLANLLLEGLKAAVIDWIRIWRERRISLSKAKNDVGRLEGRVSGLRHSSSIAATFAMSSDAVHKAALTMLSPSWNTPFLYERIESRQKQISFQLALSSFLLMPGLALFWPHSFSYGVSSPLFIFHQNTSSVNVKKELHPTHWLLGLGWLFSFTGIQAYYYGLFASSGRWRWTRAFPNGIAWTSS